MGTNGYFNEEEVNQNKWMGVISYLGFWVLVPILMGDKKSEYVRFHINQGLTLYVIDAIVGLIKGNWLYKVLPDAIAAVMITGLTAIEIVFFVLMILGIISAWKGVRRKLPVIGNINILK